VHGIGHIVARSVVQTQSGAAGLGLRILLAGRSDKRPKGAPPHEKAADLGQTLALLRSGFPPAMAGNPPSTPEAPRMKAENSAFPLVIPGEFSS